MTDLYLVIFITVIAGTATGLGAIPVFFESQISHRAYDGALGLAAGIMLSASVFALIIPGSEVGSIVHVIIGVASGGLLLLIANRLLPHIHTQYVGLVHNGTSKTGEMVIPDRFRRALLIGGAITLHNAPEGLAIGIAFASGLEGIALVLAFVIGFQNIPDGFAFAVPMGATGISRGNILLYTTLSGAVPQVVSAVIGFSLVSVVTGLFPLAAGFAAGAMMAVIFREMIPASHGHGYADIATLAFLIGFLLVIGIEIVFPV